MSFSTKKTMMKISYIALLVLVSVSGFAQNRILSINDAMDLSTINHPQIKINFAEIDRERSLLPSAYQFNNTELIFEAPTGTVLRPGFLQSFDFPSVYGLKRKYLSNQIEIAEASTEITVNYLHYRVRMTCNDLLYYTELSQQYRKQDSVLSDLLRVSQIRFDVGQISYIEKINAESQYRKLQYRVFQAQAELIKARNSLAFLIGSPNDTAITISDKFGRNPHNIGLLAFDTIFPQNPLTFYNREVIQSAQFQLKLQKAARVPGLILGYLNQGQDNTDLVYQLRFGISIPFSQWLNPSKIRAAEKELEVAEKKAVYTQYTLSSDLQQALNSYAQFSEALKYFENYGLEQSNQILAAARESYRLGSINYYNYLLNIQQAFDIQVSYLDALRNFNQAIINLQYINAQ
jgi:outer membrane protein TolC